MAFTQSMRDKIGLNPTLQSESITGLDYHYHEMAGRKMIFGTGNPEGEISAEPGSMCFTDEGVFFCNGNGSGGTGTVWFANSNKPLTATATKNVVLTVTHTLGHVAQVWAVNAAGELVDVAVYDITTSGFKVESVENCTVYYR